MPFGIIKASFTFQRLMNDVLHGEHDFSLAYPDDILIQSLTLEDHLKHLTIAFDKLRVASLKIWQKKCTFGEANCVYLGYVVGSGKGKPM